MNGQDLRWGLPYRVVAPNTPGTLADGVQAHGYFCDLLRGYQGIASLHFPDRPGLVATLLTEAPYDGPPKWVWCFKGSEMEAALLLRGRDLPTIWLILPVSSDPQDLVGISLPDLTHKGQVYGFPQIPPFAPVPELSDLVGSVEAIRVLRRNP